MDKEAKTDKQRNHQPLLSVIVPIYGVEDYLEECIQSILFQTYRNLEIILVDDGAKGKEPEICDHYARTDDRIQVVHKENGGLVAARKSGLEKATGDYVAFVDGDDYLAKDYYDRLMAWVVTEKPDLVACGITKVWIDKTESLSQAIEDNVYEGEKLLYLLRNMNCKGRQFYEPGIFTSTCLKVYRMGLFREIAKVVPNDIRMGEDAAFTYAFLLRSQKVVVDNTNKGYFYRSVEGSMTGTADVFLFTGTSMLYEFLLPYYEKSEDTAIREQLEYYRAYLQLLAINRWMAYVPLFQTHTRRKKVQELVGNTTLFQNLERVCSLEHLWRSLRVYLYLIDKSLWVFFELLWAVKNRFSSR